MHILYMYWSKLLPNSTLPIVNFHEEGVKIQPVDSNKSLVTIIVYDGKSLCYIPSCDRVAHVYLSGLVGRVQDWRAEGSGFDPGSGKKKKKKAFSILLLLLYINK